MRRRYGDVPVGKTDEKPHRSSRIRDDVNPEIVHMTKNSTSSPNNTALIHPRGVGGVCPWCSDTRGAGKRTCNQEENIPEST